MHINPHKKVNEYDQEIPQPSTADRPMTPRGIDTESINMAS